MNKRNLLIVEDEVAVAKQLKWGLGSTYDISMAHDPGQARSLLKKAKYSVVILDLGLPPNPDNPVEGFKLLEEIVLTSPQTKVIVTTGNSEHENAVRAIGLGAADFYAKPVDLNLLSFILERTFKIHELEQINEQMRQRQDSSGSFCGMLGVSPAMTNLFTRIRQVSATDYPVLITGASGTGKEMAALAVHKLSRRASHYMVIINCGAIPENLLESELYGYEKGAFTGAVSRKAGRLQQANKGTLFLDEIGELPLSLQVKILRFLQEGTIERVGSEKTITLDTRIIAATNVDLEAAVRDGTFRQDLFFRLNVVPLKMPDLKERPEDILLLAQNYLREESKALGRSQVRFMPEAISAMTAYDWPGNVRELHNRIRRALGTSTSQAISSNDLGFENKKHAMAMAMDMDVDSIKTLKEARDAAEIKAIRQALTLKNNNISQAARLLQISRPTLHDLLKKHHIET